MNTPLWIFCIWLVLNFASLPFQIFYYLTDYIPFGSKERGRIENRRIDRWLLNHGNHIRSVLAWFVHIPFHIMLWLLPAFLWGWAGCIVIIFILFIERVISDDDGGGELPSWLIAWNYTWSILCESPEARRYRLAKETSPYLPHGF